MISRKTVRVLDVAKAAGVSSATVSRAFNSPEKLRPEVYARVMEAVDTLGYTLNNAARALRSRRTRICGAILPTLNHAIYAAETNAVEERLGEEGYTLLVATSEYDVAREFSQAKMLVERGAEGLVLVGDVHDPRLYDLLRLRGVPFVNTYVFNPDSGHPCVGFDNYRAMAKIVEYLVRLGHEKFGLITGLAKDNDRVQERLKGIHDTLKANGLSVTSDQIIEKPYSLTAGYEAMRMLANAKVSPTAVVCFSDILAIGAIAYCADLSLVVPDDVSIVGFDNLAFSAYIRPPLTTLEIPAKEMGKLAAEYLMKRIEGETPTEHQELDTRLITRATTARWSEGPP